MKRIIAAISYVVALAATYMPEKQVEEPVNYSPIIHVDDAYNEIALEHEELKTIDRQGVNKTPDKLYDVPLDAQLQHYIKKLCDEYNVDMELVLAIIEKESVYNQTAVNFDGSCLGLMQIHQYVHVDRMARLGVESLFIPKQNVLTGIDLLAELSNKYGREDVHFILMCYNAGEGGALTMQAQGIVSTSYSRDVMAIKEHIHELKLKDDTQATKRNKQQRVQVAIQ